MSAMTRRRWLGTTLVAGSALMFRQALAKRLEPGDLARHVEALERVHGGRLGVCIVDVASGRRVAHRAGERFPMCSTFKTLVAAYVLARVDRGEERPDRRIVFGHRDLVSHSPVTERHLGGDGMTLDALCHATLTTSDNTAANLLLSTFGGPSALTAWLRTLGDETTRLDRIEPDLNQVAPDDPRDTTTPAAMLATFRVLTLDNVLSPASREKLVDWLVANTTGGKRLRAGLPAGWRVGDKTGSSGPPYGVSNDVGIAWPPSGGPLLMAVYHAAPDSDGETRNRVIADVGRIAAGLVA